MKHQNENKINNNNNSFNTEFSTENIFSIWFCKPNEPETQPLGKVGKLNYYRLVSHKAHFPNDTLILISNYTQFTEEKQKELITFCKKYDIKLISLATCINAIKKSKKITDKNLRAALLKIAEQEINAEEGMLVSASDIARAAIYGIFDEIDEIFADKNFIYKDFDINKITQPNNKKLNARNSLIVNGVFYVNEKNELRMLDINNNIIVCNEDKTDFLKTYRKLILSRYTDIQEIINMFCGLTVTLKSGPNSINSYNIISKEIAEKAIQMFINIKDEKNKELPLAIIFRGFMQKILDEKIFQLYILESTKYLAGPLALNDTILLSISQKDKAFPYNKELNLPPKEKLDRHKNFCFLHHNEKIKFHDDSDRSWLKDGDGRNATLNKIEKSVDIIGSALKGCKIRKDLLEQEKAALSLQNIFRGNETRGKSKKLTLNN